MYIYIYVYAPVWPPFLSVNSGWGFIRLWPAYLHELRLHQLQCSRMVRILAQLSRLRVWPLLSFSKNIDRSRTHTHTHTDREQHPRHRHTPTRQEQHPKPPNEHPSRTLNNARRCERRIRFDLLCFVNAGWGFVRFWPAHLYEPRLHQL